MSFRLSVYNSGKRSETVNGIKVKGNVCEYVCTEEADVTKLPRVGVAGTQEGTPVDNASCWYGSVAVVATGTSTSMFILTPDNVWVKM